MTKLASLLQRTKDLEAYFATLVLDARSVRGRTTIHGTLNAKLKRRGKSSMTVYRPSKGGGLGVPAGFSVEVVDVGLICKDLNSGKIVHAHYEHGIWVVGDGRRPRCND